MTTPVIQLSYSDLRAMAVSPGLVGAYSNSPLGKEIGLHTHSSSPAADVHVVVDGYKIAEVFPSGTYFYPQAWQGFAQGIAARLPQART